MNCSVIHFITTSAGCVCRALYFAITKGSTFHSQALVPLCSTMFHSFRYLCLNSVLKDCLHEMFVWNVRHVFGSFIFQESLVKLSFYFFDQDWTLNENLSPVAYMHTHKHIFLEYKQTAGPKKAHRGSVWLTFFNMSTLHERQFCVVPPVHSAQNWFAADFAVVKWSCYNFTIVVE